MSTIALKNINKSYEKGVAVVKDFNLEVKDQEFIIFVGPSGCGKSTVLRMIAGLEEISEGELWINGELANYVEPKDRQLAMVFQNYALYPHMSVYDNLAFPLQVKKCPKEEIDQKVNQVAKILQIEELLMRKPRALSGGQKQRVAIGSTLTRETKLLLMDEPLSNLDAKLRTEMRIELAKIHKELKPSIIYVTHDQTEAMTLASRIVVMKDGQIQQVDTPENIYNYPQNKFVADFIGTPSMNFFDIEIVAKGLECYMVFGAEKVKLKGRLKKALSQRKVVGKSLVMGIRPEDIYEVKEQDLFKENQIEIQIQLKELLGHEAIWHFDIAGKGYCMKASTESQVLEKDQVKVIFDQDRMHFFDRDTEENILKTKH